MSDLRSMVMAYRGNGFTPFPLAPNTKLPVAQTNLTYAAKMKFVMSNNVGIFAGSPNGLAIIDADDPFSDALVAKRLRDMGLYDWTTIVLTPKRKSHHYWLRLADRPEHAQAYYKLHRNIGGGEFRVRHPAYVVAPGSCIPEGEYIFLQGGIEFFTGQPAVSWADLLWLSPERMINADKAQGLVPGDRLLAVPFKMRFYEKPTVLILMDHIDQPDERGRVRRIDYRSGQPIDDWFDTRSEAEAAVVTGLVWAGWSFDQIEELFEQRQPGHYASMPNKGKYLMMTYNKGVRYVINRRGSHGGSL